MKIIESSIIGKKSPEACEDGMVVTDDFIAVIDGSTSKTPKHLNPDMKNGRYAMMLISEYIREELKADASVDDFCQGVTAYIYNKVYEKLGVEERLKEHPEERLTASAILYSRTRNEVWMVGDCQAIIDGKLYENGKPYEEKIARKRVELIEQGLSPAEARKQIEPLLIEAMLSGQNQTYTVIDGFPIYREGVKVVSVSDSSSVQGSVSSSDSCSVQDPVSCSGSASASDIIPSSSSEIVLASDGYPFLNKRSFSYFSQFFAIFSSEKPKRAPRCQRSAPFNHSQQIWLPFVIDTEAQQFLHLKIAVAFGRFGTVIKTGMHIKFGGEITVQHKINGVFPFNTCPLVTGLEVQP